MKKWDVFKRAFRMSLTVNMTTTKLIAWVILVLTFATIELIPLDARAYYVTTLIGIVAVLYTGKNIQEYLVKDKEEKFDTFVDDEIIEERDV